MSQRTSIQAVRILLASDYDSVRNTDLQQFINMAYPYMDMAMSVATQQPWNYFGFGVPLIPTTFTQELIERNLAAHFYTMSDRQYKSKATGGSSGSFAFEGGVQLDQSSYGQNAQTLDTSGMVRALAKRNFARGFNIGGRGFRFSFPALGDITTLPFCGHGVDEN